MLEIKLGGLIVKTVRKIQNYEKTLEPRFRDPNELSYEQLNDPDYAFKYLERINNGNLLITCSKCHHCR